MRRLYEKGLDEQFDFYVAEEVFYVFYEVS
jgi:hypothetical protein